MPAITSDILLGLLRRAAASPSDCIAATGPDNEPEPLCAAYHRRCLPAVALAIREKRFKMRDLLTELGFELMPVDPAAIANINTPSEWAQFEPRVP